MVKAILVGLFGLLIAATTLHAEPLFINQSVDQVVRMNNKGSLKRDVQINMAALNAATIQIDTFFSDSVNVIVTDKQVRSKDNYTLYGKIPTHGKSQVILTVVNGHLGGNIRLIDNITNEAQIYEITPNNDGSYTLYEILPESFPDDHPNLVYASPDSSITQADTADTADSIGVLILYSAQSGTAIGASAQVFAQQAVDSVNNAWANSGITTRLKLVYTYVSTYSESGDFNTDLNRLTGTSDGYLDNIHTLRDTYGADMVSMFIENGQYCGLGWIGPYASYAFTVVNRGCAVSNLSFAHELGHNFGALHDPYVDSSTSPYAYGHGYAVPNERWRTVMAYNNACTAVGVSCTRLAYFSNPNKLYGSTPMGTVTTSNNARVINENAYTVANFRVTPGQPAAPPPPTALYLVRI